MATVLIITFLIALFLGLPVFLTMCIAALFAFIESGSIAMTMLPQQIFAGINSFPVMAIPLFILASDLMTEGKLTDMLIQFCNDYLGRISGGLGHVNVAISMLFGGISGSAVADAAGPSKIVMFMMRGAGYDRYYAGALTASSSVIGIIIPPSIPMVIYALSDGKTSTMGLFAAGYIPGIITGLALMAANAFVAKRKGYPAALAFESYVENRTNGEIDVVIYPNSELGDGPAVLEAMQANTIQMTVVHDGPVSALFAPLGVFNMPFLFNNHTEAWTIYDSDYTKKLGDAMLEATGIRLLGLADNGIRHLTNSVRPIKSVADAAGLTIRIQPSAIYNAIISGIGANAVEVAWSELPAALQQGVADGQENGITNILAANLYETQKYITLDGHVYSYHAYLISEEFYQSLTEEQQQVIQDAVDLVKWIHRGMTSYQDNMIAPVLSSYGMEVTELTPEAIQEFREATQPTVVEWMKKEYGGTWVDDLLAEIEKLRN